MPATVRTKRITAAARKPSTPARPVDAARFEKWLLELTSLPTAAGKEERVIAWIERWTKERSKDLQLDHDPFGNLLITQRRRSIKGVAPIWFQAHLDHPAFVVRAILDAKTIELEFRGGVHDPYFDHASIEVIDEKGRATIATITSIESTAKPFKIATARLKSSPRSLSIGDIGRWLLPKPKIAKGLLHTHGCDDLAAVAAALCALDRIRAKHDHGHVGILLTRAEEIGFIGTIGAARAGTLATDARVICLENSRSFAESPIGGGPILRVGDRRSVFTPELTNRIGDVLLAHQKMHPSFVFQRKLMAGGSCEATAFAAYGYRSTCLCLPLGNYHNMADIDGVLAGKRPAKVASEFISISDFHGLIGMLEVISHSLDIASVPATRDAMETLWKDLAFVLS